MVGTRIDKAQGVVNTAEDDMTGFTPFRFASATPITSNYTVGKNEAGPFNVNSGSKVAIVMPPAGQVPMAMYTFRAVSQNGFYLTGSQETGGTRVFAFMSGVSPIGEISGSRLEVTGGVGASVALLCDGAKFLVVGGAFIVSASQA